LNDSVLIIRSFIEDYHEKLEEVFLFPRFEKVNKLSDLVKVLRSQHEAGRNLTDQIMQLTKMKSITGMEDNQKLFELLTDFNKMYRPHEAREDTVLFPALRKIFSEKEYISLGEQFEDQENKLFGNNGFENMVQKVADIEVVLGIYDLSGFNPLLI
jgi:hemerythrin-like domain-containing protein